MSCVQYLELMSVKQVLRWAILVNGEKVHSYTILNDAIGFNRLLGDLKTVHNPEIIFEATGVYSRRFKPFLRNIQLRLHTAKSTGS